MISSDNKRIKGKLQPAGTIPVETICKLVTIQVNLIFWEEGYFLLSQLAMVWQNGSALSALEAYHLEDKVAKLHVAGIYNSYIMEAWSYI